VDAELTVGDAFHLPIGRVVLDPVFVTAETVARLDDRRVFVGQFGQLVQMPSGQLAQSHQVRLEVGAQFLRHIQPEDIPEGAIDVKEVHAPAIWSDQIRTSKSLAPFRSRIGEAGLYGHHVAPPSIEIALLDPPP
jgi:hypothetical protein